VEQNSHSRTAEMGSTKSFAGGKAEGKRQLGRPGYKLEDQIKINQKVGYKAVGYILVAQNRGELQAIVKKVHKLQVP